MDKSDFLGALRRILETDSEVLEVGRVNCWEICREPLGIRCLSGYQRARRRFEGGAVLLERDCPPYFRALAENPVILADDARSDPRTRELAESYLVPLDITALMDVPIWVRGALWGVVCHEHVGETHRWTEAERDFALSMGHIVSMAVEARERARAERIVQVSELFVGALSHDLRAPLGAIRVSAESLLGRTADPAVLPAAQRILGSTDRMTRLIEQLLDFTSIRLGGGLPLHTRETDLTEICRRVITEATAARPESVIDLHVVGDPTGIWDPDRLWQLLSNLVLNALEHGQHHEPVLLSVHGADRDRVLVRIRNRGGIPRALVPVIFEHVRLPEQGSARCRISLGLFISREIATAHGGTIDLDARPDETTFVVSLPRRRVR